ncbi:MAG: ABC transporter ATP-binding protein [Actinomycetaceae bacterium]|nr:ABC transporter ATP-binding protein [Actinomycetaceae bacterium]
MFRRFNKYFDHPETIYLLIAGYVAAAILQGLAFGALIGFLRAFLGPDPSTAKSALWVLLALGVAAFLIQSITTAYANKVSSYDICSNLTAQVGRRVSNLPLGWFDANSVGRVTAAISTEVDTLSHLASIVLPQLISATVTPATVMVVTFVYDWRLALIMLAVFPVVAVLWRWASRLLMREHRIAPRVAAQTAARTVEYAHLQPVLRAQGAAGTNWQPLNNALRAENDTVTGLMRAQAAPAVCFGVLAQAFFAAILAAGLGLVLGGHIDTPTYVAIAVMAARFTTPISQSVLYASALQECMVALDAIGTIVDSPVLPEPAVPQAPQGTRITLDDVDFGYTPNQKLFSSLSLTAPAQQITALVGPSGCGKSTITKLIARFWDVDGGSITIGGADVRSIGSSDLMAMTSMVFQDVYLFDTTIAENVRLSRPEASDEEVRDAISKAGLDAVVAGLPDGIDTRVGEGGLKLSGGERQRVSIARAFLKDAPILLLDEITSALDTENEAAVTQALADLSHGRTVIVVAHRLSTIMNADQVYVLSGHENGEPTRVVEHGSPRELAGAGGVFASLIDDFAQTARWRIR